MIILTALGNNNQSLDVNSQNQEKNEISSGDQDTILRTGWYFVLEEGAPNTIAKQLDKSTAILFLHRVPILTVSNFESVTISENATKDKTIAMQFDEIGTLKWAAATEKASRNRDRIAFIVNNVLLDAPVVNARIPNGVSAVSCGGYYSEKELEQLKKRIENEMSAKSNRNVHLLEIEKEKAN
jgi:hypothetical protein